MPVPKMVSCERVDVSFTETAPYRFCNSVDLGITPEQLFEVLADAESTNKRFAITQPG
jgi:hypothetical protein